MTSLDTHGDLGINLSCAHSSVFFSLSVIAFRKGTVFHESHGKHFSQGYCEGDVLGILIELPDIPSGNYIPPTYKDKVC